MISPYQMVIINSIFSIILIAGIIIYRYIYLKRNINLLFLLVLISLLPLISILRKGTYESGDLTIHTGFLISFYESLKDGNFIPRWSSQMIYGYGYPLFLFIYPLPYYLAALFHALGFDFINSLKIVLGTFFVISGITMYLFVKEELKNKFSAFLAALIYLFSPYHLVDLHFRVAIGEIIAFAILPFCFFAIKKLSYKITFKWFSLSAVSISLLTLSHQAISLIFFPFIITYCLYLFVTKNGKKIQYLSSYFSSLLLGLLLSSFYWIPVIAESKYINLLTRGNISFIPINQLLFSPWKWGFLFQGPKGELSLSVGYVQWFIILFSIILFFRGKLSSSEKGIYFISIVSVFLLLAMTQAFSAPIWMSVFLLKGFQFSYRLLLPVAFFVSVIAGIVVKNFVNRWFLTMLCLFTVVITILNWGNRKPLPQLNDSLIQYEFPSSMTKVGQSTTLWVNSNEFASEKRLVPHLIVIQGKANIYDLARNSVRHEYLINALSDKAYLKENTLYFPNWIVKVDNNPYPFSFTDPTYPGTIVFNLNKGLHKVEVDFLDTKIRKISSLLSLISLAALLTYGLTLGLKTHNFK